MPLRPSQRSEARRKSVRFEIGIVSAFSHATREAQNANLMVGRALA
jgi:hypothetical protein